MKPKPPRIAFIHFAARPEPGTLSAFAESCLRFSPQIGILPGRGIWIEIGKCHRLYTEEGFLKRVEALAKRFQLEPRVAFHSKLTLAYALAKHGVSDVNDLPLEVLPELVDPFSPDALTKKSLASLMQALHKVGVKSIPAFLKIPARELSSRFGAVSMMARARLEGELDLTWPDWEQEEIVIEARALGYEEQSRDLDPLMFLMKPLLDRLFSRLWARGRRLSSMELKLDLENFRHLKGAAKPDFKFDFLLPQTSSRGAMPIIRERLSRELQKKGLGSSCTGLSLTVLKHVPGYAGQRNLLESKDEHWEEWGAILSQIAESLGTRGKVFRDSIQPERLPEKAWLPESFAQIEKNQALDFMRVFPKRPSRMLKRPERVEVGQELIFIRKKPHRLKAWSRPEILTEWLGEPLYRRYYRVELEKGPGVWIFCDEKEVFFLHGYFE